MHISIDEKFKNHKKQFVIQSLMVAGVVAIVMAVMDFFSDGVLIASIAASASIAFARPHTKTAATRYLIGSYILAIFCAWITSLFMNFLFGIFPSLHYDSILIIFGAIAVGKTVFITVVTETEHPPASALALGLFINGITVKKAAVAVIAITIIAIMRKILKKHMMDLY